MSLYSITLLLEHDSEIQFGYRNVLAQTFKSDNTTYLKISVLLVNNESLAHTIQRIALDFLATLTGEAFILSDIEKSVDSFTNRLPEIQKNIFKVDNKDILAEVYNMIYKYEYANNKEKSMILSQLQLKRFDLLEKKEEKGQNP